MKKFIPKLTAMVASLGILISIPCVYGSSEGKEDSPKISSFHSLTDTLSASIPPDEKEEIFDNFPKIFSADWETIRPCETVTACYCEDKCPWAKIEELERKYHLDFLRNKRNPSYLTKASKTIRKNLCEQLRRLPKRQQYEAFFKILEMRDGREMNLDPLFKQKKTQIDRDGVKNFHIMCLVNKKTKAYETTYMIVLTNTYRCYFLSI